MLDELRINHQKVVGNKVLEILEVINFRVLLAGGAPRDWYFTRVAKDLDIYLYLPYNDLDEINNFIEFLLNKYGTKKSVNYVDEFEYIKSDIYKCIYTYNILGEDVQIIILNKDLSISDILNSFDLSLCKAWYKDGLINLSEDFKISILTNHIYLCGDNDWENEHVKRICEKYPSFKRSTYSDAIKIVDKML